MHIKDLFNSILEKIAAGEDTVLATIVAEIGSSPRSAGAHMLVDTNGRVCSTIGGGTLEYKAIQYAQGLLERQQSRRKTYRLHRNDEEEYNHGINRKIVLPPGLLCVIFIHI